jgi:hypothetical protein
MPDVFPTVVRVKKAISRQHSAINLIFYGRLNRLLASQGKS